MPYRANLALKLFPFRCRARRTRLSMFAWLREGIERQRQRRVLATLDNHLLRDIGLTAEQARAEAAKPFWKP